MPSLNEECSTFGHIFEKGARVDDCASTPLTFVLIFGPSIEATHLTPARNGWM